MEMAVVQRFNQAFRRVFHERENRCGAKLVQSLEKLYDEFNCGHASQRGHAFGNLVAASVKAEVEEEQSGGSKRRHHVVSVLDAIRGLKQHPTAVTCVRGLVEGMRLSVPSNAPLSSADEREILESLHELLRAGDGEHATAPAVERNLTDQFRLTTQTFAIFPELRFLPLDEHLLRDVFFNLLHHQMFGPAFKLFSLFVGRLRQDDFALFIEALHGAREYERMQVAFQCVLSHVSQRDLVDTDDVKPSQNACGEDILNLEFVTAVALGMVQKIASQPPDIAVASTTVALQLAVNLCLDFLLPSPIRREIHALLTTHRISQLVKKNKWQLAAQICGSNKAKQAELFRQLVDAQQYFQAQCVYDEFNLGSGGDVPQITPEQLIAQTVAETTHYLQFPLDLAADIVFVECKATLRELAAGLDMELIEGGYQVKGERLRWIGVDSEWRAEIGSQPVAGASLLQLSTATKVFLLDLVALSSPVTRTAAVEILHVVFSSPQKFRIVGWAFSKSDLSMLRQSEGGAFLDAFENVVLSPVLELNRVVSSMTQHNAKGGKKELSLSDACLLILGRPLNKSEQTSNWNERPLRPRQRAYAALDAHALLGILDVLLRGVPNASPIFADSPLYPTNMTTLISHSRGSLLERWLNSREA